MLTRDAANIELKKVVERFNPLGIYANQENDFYLDELLRLLPVFQKPKAQRPQLAPLNPAEIPESEEKPEVNPAPPEAPAAQLSAEEIETNKKLTLLRDRLRNILAFEAEGIEKSFCDDVFALQILLARISPVNKSGPTTFLDAAEYDDIEGMYDETKSPNTFPVFFSDGTAMSRKSAEAYFGAFGCYNKDRQLKDLNNKVFTEREIQSIKDQQVTIIARPSPTESYAHHNDMSIGMVIGYKIGILVSMALCFTVLFAIPVLPAFSLAAFGVGIVTAMYSGDSMTRALGFVMGFGIVTLTGGLVNLVVAPLLILTSSYSMSAASGMASLFYSIIIPYVVPTAMLGAGIISSYINDRPLGALFHQWVAKAITIPIGVCMLLGGYIEIVFPRLFPRRAAVQFAVAVNDADLPSGNVDNTMAPGNSHVLMHQMGIADLVEPRSGVEYSDDESVIEIVSDAPSSSVPPVLASASAVLEHEEDRNFYRPS